MNTYEVLWLLFAVALIILGRYRKKPEQPDRYEGEFD